MKNLVKDIKVRTYLNVAKFAGKRAQAGAAKGKDITKWTDIWLENITKANEVKPGTVELH